MHHRRKDIRTAGMSHGSASPYNYYGRTHDKEIGQLHHVQAHPGGHSLRRGGTLSSKKVESWLDRGGGFHASRKEH